MAQTQQNHFTSVLLCLNWS